MLVVAACGNSPEPHNPVAGHAPVADAGPGPIGTTPDPVAPEDAGGRDAVPVVDAGLRSTAAMPEPDGPKDAGSKVDPSFGPCDEFPLPPGMSCNPPRPAGRSYDCIVIAKLGPVEGGIEIIIGVGKGWLDRGAKWRATFIRAGEPIVKPELEVREIIGHNKVRIFVKGGDPDRLPSRNVRLTRLR